MLPRTKLPVPLRMTHMLDTKIMDDLKPVEPSARHFSVPKSIGIDLEPELFQARRARSPRCVARRLLRLVLAVRNSINSSLQTSGPFRDPRGGSGHPAPAASSSRDQDHSEATHCRRC